MNAQVYPFGVIKESSARSGAKENAFARAKGAKKNIYHDYTR